MKDLCPDNFLICAAVQLELIEELDVRPLCLCGLVASGPKTRTLWVLCRHKPPQRARRNMSEPSFARLKSFVRGSFDFFSQAIFDLASHPGYEAIPLAQRTKMIDLVP